MQSVSKVIRVKIRELNRIILYIFSSGTLKDLISKMNSSSNISAVFTNTNNPNAIVVGAGVAHIILVVIPTLILGSILLSLLLSNKKLRDPPSILFMCTTVLCMVGTVTYGLLMDISLITGFPLFGSCNTDSPTAFWALLTTFHLQLLVSTAYVSVMQYITIKWGPKKLSTAKTVVIFFLLFAFSTLGGFLNFLYNSPENINNAITTRGSLCIYPFGGVLIPLAVTFILGLLIYLVPSVTIVIVFSVLSFRHVKRHIIDNGDVVRNVSI